MTVLEFHKDRGHVPVLTGDPEALGGDRRTLRLDDFISLDMSPELQRLSSLFSSSPPMYGITLSTISGQVAKVLPAPEMA